MASRKQPRKSRRDQPVEGRKSKDADKGTVEPKYNTERETKWDEEGEKLQTDRDYGSGNSVEQPGMEDDNTDPRPYNNYDDYDKTYPGAHR